jgi:hypothetical protein
MACCKNSDCTVLGLFTDLGWSVANTKLQTFVALLSKTPKQQNHNQCIGSRRGTQNAKKLRAKPLRRTRFKPRFRGIADIFAIGCYEIEIGKE